MKRRGTFRLTRPLQTLLLLEFALVFFNMSASLVWAQVIRITVLNAHNGKAVPNECLNVSFGSWHGADLVTPTDDKGDVVLHLGAGKVEADGMPHACNGTAILGPKTLPKGVDALTISGDHYVVCQEYGKIVPGQPITSDSLKELMPSYSIDRIVKTGLTASNTCGRFRIKAIPGELVLFVRPVTWLEKMKQ